MLYHQCRAALIYPSHALILLFRQLKKWNRNVKEILLNHKSIIEFHFSRNNDINSVPRWKLLPLIDPDINEPSLLKLLPPFTKDPSWCVTPSMLEWTDILRKNQIFNWFLKKKIINLKLDLMFCFIFSKLFYLSVSFCCFLSLNLWTKIRSNPASKQTKFNQHPAMHASTRLFALVASAFR